MLKLLYWRTKHKGMSNLIGILVAALLMAAILLLILTMSTDYFDNVSGFTDMFQLDEWIPGIGGGGGENG